MGTAPIFRNGAEAAEHHPAHGVVVRVLRGIESQLFRQSVNAEAAAAPPDTVLQMLQLRGLRRGELIVDIAYDLFQQILQAHDTGQFAVLVDDHRQMYLFVLHIPEEVVRRESLRHQVGRTHQLPHSAVPGRGHIQQKIPGVQDAQNIIEIAAIDREAGQPGGADDVQDLAGRGVHLNSGDIAYPGHGVADREVAEFKDVLEQFLLLRIDGSVLVTQVDHHADLILGDLFLLVLGLHAEQTEHSIGGQGEKGHHRPGDEGKRGDHPAGETCHLQGLLHGDAFRDQLAEDQSKVGEDQSDDDHREGIHHGDGEGGKAKILTDPADQILGEAVRRKGGAEETGQRDADLDGGEEAGWLLQHFQQPGSQLVPALFQHPQLVCVEGDHRDLGSRKKGIDQDQDDLDQQLYGNS